MTSTHRSCRGAVRLTKRAFDLLAAGVVAVLALPVMLVIALAVKLDSPGPVLFRQQRVGWRGRRFAMVKFRTMVQDAERLGEDLRSQSTDPDWLKLENDPRITRVGRFLRKTSLDELPQLWNVVRGDMAVVGPRPLTLGDHACVPEDASRRMEVRPGLTGLWQVSGRTDLSFAQMVSLDCEYVDRWSPWLELKVILLTPFTVVFGRGAN